ncbi:MAG TPA: hypothetical protein DHV68_00725 [Dehalococcoidia bacterium]|nr:hypothetical protein [Chloroflexota bacterium]HCI85343.1 hypothetical protein [Dehalococcoidia bacterium]
MMSPSVRHIPARTWVVCRLKRPKVDVLRVVNTPDRQIELDMNGAIPDRGAYVCKDLIPLRRKHE